jgi:hypothetical protein
MESEALKLALEALEFFKGLSLSMKEIERAEEAITALQEALAQPEQEPPSWWPAVENILIEYGLQAIDFVADFKAALAQPAQEPFGYLSIGDNPIFQKEKPEIGRWETVYTSPPQRLWVEPTGNEWFEWWRVSAIADETEAEIDFADFLIIAQAVITKLKEKNNG